MTTKEKVMKLKEDLRKRKAMIRGEISNLDESVIEENSNTND